METLQSTPEALENYARICNEYCEKAHKILQEHADPSPVAGWAREVIVYARHLGQFEHMLGAAYVAARDMADCLFDHPRLLLELKETELEILEYIEAVQQHDLDITDDLRAEINTLRHNIQAADEERWEAIINVSHLKHDPIEWSKAYEDVIDEADHEAFSYLEDVPRGMGFCFAYWAEKRKALERRGIEWNSPSRMNPGVMFD